MKCNEIFYDVETQNDFMNLGAPLYAPGVEIIKPNLALLTNFAKESRKMKVGGADTHFGTSEYAFREIELQINGGPFPMHCKKGTYGAEKIKETLFETVRHPHFLDEKVDYEIIKKGLTIGGLIFEKQTYNVFTNPAVKGFLDYAEVKKAVVYGVLTDWCVKDAVLGLQENGVQTYVVTDAIYALNLQQGEGEKALEEMINAGARLVTTKEVLEGKI
ncbi:MAG: cysteine hydrolase family protein [Nanoarchaeota archaeon]|nr:cysteine hydrolase family protein [Nanoarchaeota archaeon]